MLRLLSSVDLSARFERLMVEVQAANRAMPRTNATKAKAKALLAQLREITAEMRRRSDFSLDVVAAGDAVIEAANNAAGAFSSFTNKVVLGLALVGFALYQLKK